MLRPYVVGIYSSRESCRHDATRRSHSTAKIGCGQGLYNAIMTNASLLLLYLEPPRELLHIRRLYGQQRRGRIALAFAPVGPVQPALSIRAAQPFLLGLLGLATG